MRPQREPDLVAVDWGTTSLRGCLVVDGVVVAEVTSADGVSTLGRPDYPARLSVLLAQLGATSGLVLISGMAGSAGGWTEVPCIPLPARAGDLALALARPSQALAGQQLAAFDVRLVPGVADIRDGRLRDLMRGEEVEFLGAGGGDGVAVFPGSHSKWVLGEQDAVVGLTTFLTGEAYLALGRHTLLRRSLPEDLQFGDEHRGEFLAGVDASAGDLLQTLFTVRVRGLNGTEPGAGAAWLSGLLIGSEVRAGLRWAGGPSMVTLGGGPTLQPRYRTALEHLDTGVQLVPPLAAARGLVELARRMEQP